MTVYTHSAEADIEADKLAGFLSDPRNLPRYFPRITAAEPADGDTVHVEAELDGRHVERDARFHFDGAERLLQWGTDGPDDYRGDLRVEEISASRSRITVSLHSARWTQNSEVQRALEQAVSAFTEAAAADQDRV
jgi:hypothetical protein